MALEPDLPKRKVGWSRIVIERSAVANFARAIKDPKPEYLDPRAAVAAGLSGIAVPPTFLMAAAKWGCHPELQPQDGGSNPLHEVLDEFKSRGGLLLSGEQSLTFERPLKVGDVLDAETELADTYARGPMTFAVLVTRYTDAATGQLVATSEYTMINRSAD